MLHLIQSVIEPLANLFVTERTRVNKAFADLEAKLMDELKALEAKLPASAEAEIDALGQKVAGLSSPAPEASPQ